MNDKVIFLDFDGVLNNERAFITCQEETAYVLDPYCVHLVEEVCKKCDLQVVISSSWRAFGLDCIKEAFQENKCEGLIKYIHKDWRTPNIHRPDEDARRGEEIKAWLKKHAEVTKYLCIDDDSDFLPGQPLLLTSFVNGFTFIDQLTAEDFFGHSEESLRRTARSHLRQWAKISEHNLKLLGD